MFRNVIVGVNGHPGGRDAVALAKRLVDPDGRITLVHVHDGVVSRLPTIALWSEDQAAASRRLLQEERETAGRIDAVDVADVCAPTPGEGLHRYARRSDADLLVVGGSDRHGIERAIVGDDAHAALNGAPCAVAVAPHGYADGATELRHVAVGYDGSPESEAALDAARALATRTGGDVEALEAVRPPAVIAPGPWEDVLDALFEEAHKRVDALPGVRGVVVQGSPAPALIALSERVDLLVLGSRSYGPIRCLVFGSTSDDVSRRARCPVLVLPRSAVASVRTADEAAESTSAA